MGDRHPATWALLTVVLGTSNAIAQDYSYPTPPPQNQPYTKEPAYAPAPTEKVGSHRGFQGGFNIGVPIWLDVDRAVIRPGADLHFFGGYDIGYAMFGLDLGAMWTPIDLGIAFLVKKGVHIDLGVKYSLSGPGDFFVRREQWVTPYLGVLMR